jgi:hypothetical protein
VIEVQLGSKAGSTEVLPRTSLVKLVEPALRVVQLVLGSD